MGTQLLKYESTKIWRLKAQLVITTHLSVMFLGTRPTFNMMTLIKKDFVSSPLC